MLVDFSVGRHGVMPNISLCLSTFAVTPSTDFKLASQIAAVYRCYWHHTALNLQMGNEYKKHDEVLLGGAAGVLQNGSSCP